MTSFLMINKQYELLLFSKINAFFYSAICPKPQSNFFQVYAQPFILLLKVSLLIVHLYNYKAKVMGCSGSQMITEVHPLPMISPPSIFVQSSPKENQSLNFSSEQKKGDELFRQGKCLQAIAVYKKIIESGYNLDFEIEGLGNYNLGFCHYQWAIYDWYDEERNAGKFKGNVFDALALCYYQIKDQNSNELQKGLVWYEDMLSERQSYELYIGYAHIYYNLYKYDDALKAYHKFLKMKPNFINAMVSIMFLHQFNRIQKAKSIAMAEKILELDPENMYAHFVSAKNEPNVDDRINLLITKSEKFPRYIRLINEIGLAYGVQNNHLKAIQYYKKCTQINPKYSDGYCNIAIRTYLLGQYTQALQENFRAIEMGAKYTVIFANSVECFRLFSMSDEEIIAEMRKYPKIIEHDFYYSIAQVHLHKPELQPQYDLAIVWLERALSQNRTCKVLHSMGRAYQGLADYENSERCYLQSIQLNPKFKMNYLQMGVMSSGRGKIEEAIGWYRKAIEVDPSFHSAYNNLGIIFMDQNKIKEATQFFKKCVELHSTYTLGYCNLAICYLKQEMYQDAFTVFARAKELLPTDNNGLSWRNRDFLEEQLENFDKEGQRWRKTGSIGQEQKEQLRSLIRQFQSNFRSLYSSEASFKRTDEQVLKPDILEIVRLVHEDKFSLKNIEKIFASIKHLFHEDQAYFHIIPQLFIQYFWNNNIKEGRPILSIEAELTSIIKDISSKESKTGGLDAGTKGYSLDMKLKNFNPPKDFKVNLFEETAYFSSYEVLYSEIVKENEEAEQSLKEFTTFVENVRSRSNGIPYGVSMKMPKRADQQFKVVLRILEKMFKKEINAERVNKIIQTIDENLKKKGSSVTLLNIVHEIMEVWTKEITSILQERLKNQVETTCAISDLLRGKIMFNTVEDLAKAIDACDKLCKIRGYEILELDNRLSKPQTMDVVLKIKVNLAVCEFQLAMRQDQSKYHFIHSIYEIERSPLGCIFGSYLFMSKGFNYPILANCKDIEERLKTSEKEEDKSTVEAARYIINALEEKQKL